MANACSAFVEPRLRERAGPFLKWVGGKGKLVPQLHARLPPRMELRRHVEPFLGGGALFFSCCPPRALLSDVNADLVETYLAVRDAVDEVLIALDRLADAHCELAYYGARERYNRREHGNSAARAALFIYLNKTGFNGLYRVNARGQFNVPMGRYTSPSIVDPKKLRAASERLRSVELRAVSFEALVRIVGTGDFVYLDPPYEPVSRTANFTSYTAAGFTRGDHVRLSEVFRALDGRGAKLMLSSSDVPFIRELYRGYRIEHVMAARAVSSCPGSRGPVRELVIRNYAHASATSARGEE